MIHPKTFLKQFGTKLGVIGPLPDESELCGETRLESLRTIYRFRDGECVEVERRHDCTPVDQRLVGMRLVGWLADNRLLVRNWQQGARGVLWRPAAGAGGTIAMTTATFAFVVDRRFRTRDAAPAKLASRPPMESLTRVMDAPAVAV
jgi:hypothetical protein